MSHSHKPDTGELVLKTAASFLATAVFLLLAWGVLDLLPPSASMDSSERNASEGTRPAKRDSIPRPPRSRKIHLEETPKANLRIYESGLTQEAAHRFYLEELARLGWRAMETPPPGDAGEQAILHTTLHFTDGARHCIISIDEKDAYNSLISVIQTETSQNGTGGF